jgi:4-diphosphocytidyl-2-C-methyl-D-erythritol kinase
MVIFPNCKINLGLRILRKREDGYHDLETIFYPLGIKDVLEVITSTNAETTKANINFHQSGLAIDGDASTNLCVRAFELLRKEFPSLASIEMHLHKNIPLGAGLGGGSADAAFALKLIDEKFQLGLSREKLIDLALRLGSDCPFFIINSPAYATGRGEFLEPLSLSLSAYNFLVVSPGVHISTAKAFSLVTPAVPNCSLKEIVQKPIDTWKTELVNDFEQPVFNLFPEIKFIKEELYRSGALYASLTGSGSSVFGIFEKKINTDNLFEKKYRLDWAS